jgi:hypothetical protein
MWFMASAGKKVRPYLKNNLKQKRSGDVAQMGEYLPSQVQEPEFKPQY